jgi:histone demethylase JARID1
MSSLSTSLKNSYQRYLQPYEEWARTAKPGVQQQIEAEYGVPITPSPATSPLKKMPVDKQSDSPGSSLCPDSPAIRASSALATSLGTPDRSDTEMLDAPSAQGTPVMGAFMVNASGSGFTPVNSRPTSFTPVNASNGVRRELESAFASNASSRRCESGFESRGESPEDRSSAGSPFKRDRSQENGSDPKDQAKETTTGSENGERRSKRLRKGAAFCATSVMCSLTQPFYA